MLKAPACKYQPVLGPSLPNRQWPNARAVAAPVWLSTDLRDGNQSLFEPMDEKRKTMLFKMLVNVGFKEIEIAFPAASQTEFDFTRSLIQSALIPDDVTVMVMTPARAELIERTFEALRGARKAIISLFNATAPVWRRDVYGLEREAVRAMAVDHARLVKQHFDNNPCTQWTLQYSPEAFSATELPFALEVCNAVIDVMAPTPERPMIINLPATVEMSTPNVFADQVEWMHRHLHARDGVILSVHPHNDRGTAVAAAEMALLAGAQRVEGCLFGQGERSGNVDLVTLALNLYTQGISPDLDFSDIDEIQRTVEYCSRLPISPRHPYAGEMVYTAFSGSHQDAIRKGMTRRQLSDTAKWEVPYLPIDPQDLGRDYASLIRVNSQSGKGGIAYLLETHLGLKMPRRMLIDFSGVVQRHAEHHGHEVSAETLMALWLAHYQPEHALKLISHQITRSDVTACTLTMTSMQEASVGQGLTPTLLLHGQGRDLLDASLNALERGLGWSLSITTHEAAELTQSSPAMPQQTAVMVEACWQGKHGRRWGVSLHADPQVATVQALLHAAATWDEASYVSQLPNIQVHQRTSVSREQSDLAAIDGKGTRLSSAPGRQRPRSHSMS